MSGKLMCAALVTAFLGAGVATSPAPQPTGQVTAPASANVTTISKTDVNWPARGFVTVEPCRYHSCQEA